jgi:hypothetical protein
LIGFGPIGGTQWVEKDGKQQLPYNKREKIGKICDFVSLQAMNNPQQAINKGGAKVAIAKDTDLYDEEEKGFELVDDDVVVKKKNQKIVGNN